MVGFQDIGRATPGQPVAAALKKAADKLWPGRWEKNDQVSEDEYFALFASVLGSLNGCKRSPKKAKKARKNGRKGGRPANTPPV